ncbi:hypothetical protein bcgnr5378_05870 [Bacillus cereus]|uniref:hypothetical protein n=1 Tax=Bacillus cereus TaxID=1396 RepID=UPI0012907B9F|nr:hypothetical protein [Bacillus cereus]
MTLIVGILYFSVLTATYAGVLFLIAKVSFFGIMIPSYWDALQFYFVLSLLALVTGFIMASIIAYFKEKNPNLFNAESISIRLFLISFLSTFTTWFIVDLLIKSVSISLGALFVIALIMSVYHYGKLKETFSESTAHDTEEISDN